MNAGKLSNKSPIGVALMGKKGRVFFVRHSKRNDNL